MIKRRQKGLDDTRRVEAESKAESGGYTAKKIEARTANWATAVGKVFCGHSKHSENVKDGVPVSMSLCVCLCRL